jgi:1-aminocyclopropane-1-carboxylate deaminase/D-cysteine desulfhydrase-like pyridoxal-dependent ACC family enzyme
MKNKMDDIKNILKEAEKLTPIEKYENILLKREDKFILKNVNGGKLRQALFLIYYNLNKIQKEHNNTVICCSSIKSPQSSIIASVCNLFNLKCNILTYKTEKANRNLTIAQEEEANIYGSKIGYQSVLEHYAKTKECFQNNFFVNFGFFANEVIKININQTNNLPKDLDYLVIPIGSSLNFISIIKGLIRNKNMPKEIIGVYVGRDPFKKLTPLNFDINYLNKLNIRIIKAEERYGAEVNINNNFFDPIYEAKAYKYIEKNLNKNKKILLWVIGKRNLVISPKKINYLELS